MNWLDVSIETMPAGIDPVCARLIAMGIEGMQIEDFDDFQNFLEDNKKYWDYVDEELVEKKRGATKVKIYLPQSADGIETLAMVRAEMQLLRKDTPDTDLGSLEITVGTVGEEDWENEWKIYYKPTPIGERLLILPEWEERPETNRVVFLNNPGMTFGTGTHASTRLALEAIEKWLTGGVSVLDLGCGSGILAICALLLGASRCDAVDIDHLAVDVTERNAVLNGVSVRAFAGDVLSDSGLVPRISGGEKYDAVFANIVADVIVNLPPVVVPALKTGGLFITSGIIEPRLSDVTSALESGGFEVLEVLSDEGWCCVVARRAERNASHSVL